MSIDDADLAAKRRRLAVAKTYRCLVCMKHFSHRSSLWNHKKTHRDARYYRCNVCDKEYKWKNSLRFHANIHLQRKQIAALEEIHDLSKVLDRRSFGEVTLTSNDRSLTAANARPAIKAEADCEPHRSPVLKEQTKRIFLPPPPPPPPLPSSWQRLIPSVESAARCDVSRPNSSTNSYSCSAGATPRFHGKRSVSSDGGGHQEKSAFEEQHSNAFTARTNTTPSSPSPQTVPPLSRAICANCGRMGSLVLLPRKDERDVANLYAVQTERVMREAVMNFSRFFVAAAMNTTGRDNDGNVPGTSRRS